MKQHTSEAEFQKWVVAAFTHQQAHVQVHGDRHYVGIPDLSAAYMGEDFWLELKYGEFTVDREYDDFEFREVTRQQLEWLRLRDLTGGAYCGILGYFRVKPLMLTHYVFFMSAKDYLEKLWRNNGSMSAGAIILSPYVEDASRIDGPGALVEFIKDAHHGRHAQRGRLAG